MGAITVSGDSPNGVKTVFFFRATAHRSWATGKPQEVIISAMHVHWGPHSALVNLQCVNMALIEGHSSSH